jgi:hypothetical protein
LDDGFLSKRRIVCRAIEIGTAETSIRRAKQSGNGNSGQDFPEVGDQILALQPWSTMPDNYN